MLSDCNLPFKAISSPLCARAGAGHITLESLLDSPGLTPPSPLSESQNGEYVMEHGVTQIRNHIHLAQSTQNTADGNHSGLIPINEPQRLVFLRDVCAELLCVLRSQDINGYFLSSLPALGPTKGLSRVGLLDIEKRVFSNSYASLSDFQNDVMTLLSGAMSNHSDGSHVHSEAHRLFNLSSDWFASISPNHLQILNMKTRRTHIAESKSITPDKTAPEGILVRSGTPPPLASETYLGVLNPDNRGVVSRTERVRSIGDEVGALKNGSPLLPNGGYREDRRNKVIPYTYLDYGPYYSFAPRFDSGASHCSPEANRLILSTSWLPARTAYLTVKPKKSTPEPSSTSETTSTSADDCSEGCGVDEITQAIQSEAVCSALDAGDHQLAVSLAVVEMESQATAKLSAELDQILPGPEADDDCVYGLCLANAFTRDLLATKESDKIQDRSKNEASNSSSDCDLDQPELSSSECSDVYANLSPIQRELTDSANDLRALYCAQYRRLGDVSQMATTSGATLYPSSSEMVIAHRLVGRLVDLTKRAKPRDLVHPYALRRAMGMKPDLYALPEYLNESTDELQVSDLSMR
ncbi:hypothetical protein D915_000088 [Fasciola hepatica]|uniref:Bromo domain-containing protein n=1 Tax=Fasciola hepatica TaxID=6192 RepID=A0A4E0S4B8_FASHE|nr:hypothetical protein D915_000088 [Fasciola hepatica]